MKKIITISVLIISGFAQAQETGIRFEKNINWEELLQKAKAENKYIFVDCYATWCGPCKMMDQEIYPLKEVGDVFNKEFISVKVQMNKTDNDNEWIKKWYDDTYIIQRNYGINAYPTFLFFSPDGKPVHKVSGARNKEDFLQLAEDAHSPEKQYYTLVRNFKSGTIDTLELKSLIFTFQYSDKELGGKMAVDYLNRISPSELRTIENCRIMIANQDNPEVLKKAIEFIKLNGIAKSANFISFFPYKEEVQQLAIHYIKNLPEENIGKEENYKLLRQFNQNNNVQEVVKKYLDGLTDKELLKLNNIELLADFSNTTEDRGFDFFYKEDKEIDSIVRQPRFATDQARRIIENKETRMLMKTSKEENKQPDFEALHIHLAKEYDLNIADDILLDVKLDWYKFLVYTQKIEQYWPELINARIAKIEKFQSFQKISSMGAVNDAAYGEVFLHCNNQEQINIAVKWMQTILQIIPTNSNFMDTYACVLYKAGRIDEAIKWETKAATLNPKDKETADTLEKMKKGEHFWKK